MIFNVPNEFEAHINYSECSPAQLQALKAFANACEDLALASYCDILLVENELAADDPTENQTLEHCAHERSRISDDGKYWVCAECEERQSSS